MVRDFHAQKETERVILRLGWRTEGAEPLLGSPVLFGSGHFDALRALPEGKGGGAVIRPEPRLRPGPCTPGAPRSWKTRIRWSG